MGEVGAHQEQGCVTGEEAGVTHTLMVPITVHRCESWAVKKADRERWIHLPYGGGQLCAYPGSQKDEQVGSEAS